MKGNIDDEILFTLLKWDTWNKTDGSPGLNQFCLQLWQDFFLSGGWVVDDVIASVITFIIKDGVMAYVIWIVVIWN